MAIIVQCKSCGKKFTLRDEMGGKVVKCSACDASIHVPMAGEQLAVSAEGPMPTNEPPLSSQTSAEPSSPQKNGLATASLICGIVGIFLCFPLAIAGFVMGIVALSQISSSNEPVSGRGKAIAGICISAIAATLIPIAILAGMLLPALARAREEARKTVCKNNLKQIGLSMHMYAGDWSDEFPTTGVEGDSAGSLGLLYSAYQPNTKLYTCPSTSDPASTAPAGPNFLLGKNEVSYHYVNGLSLAMPSDTPLAWDNAHNHDGSGRNVLFVGGHVMWAPEPHFAAEIENFDYSKK